MKTASSQSAWRAVPGRACRDSASASAPTVRSAL